MGKEKAHMSLVVIGHVDAGKLTARERVGLPMKNMRNEYVELIGSYIENGTPRLDKNRLDDYDKRLSAVETYEKRIKVLEERPKFNVTGGLPKDALTKENLTKDNLNKLPLEKVKLNLPS